jgi:hypothetical protein
LWNETFITDFGLKGGLTHCSLHAQALPSKDLPFGKENVQCSALRTLNDLSSGRIKVANMTAGTLCNYQIGSYLVNLFHAFSYQSEEFGAAGSPY